MCYVAFGQQNPLKIRISTVLHLTVSLLPFSVSRDNKKDPGHTKRQATVKNNAHKKYRIIFSAVALSESHWSVGRYIYIYMLEFTSPRMLKEKIIAADAYQRYSTDIPAQTVGRPKLCPKRTEKSRAKDLSGSLSTFYRLFSPPFPLVSLETGRSQRGREREREIKSENQRVP